MGMRTTSSLERSFLLLISVQLCEQEVPEHIKLESLLQQLRGFSTLVNWRSPEPPFMISFGNRAPHAIVMMYNST